MAHQYGSVEVITGSMFCGKTEELIRRLRRATIARQKVQVFKPVIDDRLRLRESHFAFGADFAALPISTSAEILAHLEPETTVVGIDEAQFFDDGIVDVVSQMADRGIRVIVNGLDTDFRGEPFGCMRFSSPRLNMWTTQRDLHGFVVSRLPHAKVGERQTCALQRPIVIVGASELYEARCRRCHQVPRD
jgi:thymidine kinase